MATGQGAGEACAGSLKNQRCVKEEKSSGAQKT